MKNSLLIIIFTSLFFGIKMTQPYTALQPLPDKIQRPPVSVKIDSSINPPDIQTVILQLGQYHFVPLGSFFQYSISGWQFGFASAVLSKITIQYNINIQSQTSTFNFIVLNSSDANSAKTFNCYFRAVNEGLPQLMQLCQFNYTLNPSGTCAQSIQQAAQDNFITQNIFMNCTDLQNSYNYNITLNDGQSSLNNTLLFLIDNSGLFPLAAHPDQLINLILTYSVIAQINEQDKAKMFMICSLTSVVILIMIVFAIILNCKIRRLDKQIQEQKRNKFL